MLKILAVLSAVALGLSGCSAAPKERGAPGTAATPWPDDGPPAQPRQIFASARDALYASPAGGDAACARDSPCTLTEALSRAESGGTVALLDGDYGKLVISAIDALDRMDGHVSIMPAEGSSPVIGSLDLRSPNTAWKGIRFTGALMIRGFAPNTELNGIHVDGAGVFVRAKNVVVRDSLLENGVSTDGIQVGQAEAVLIEGNRIRNYAQKDAGGFHADCIQMFDSRDITIRGNILSNCYNASLIFSPGKGDGTHNVLIESNFVQGCPELNDVCRGGVTLDMRSTDENTGITVRNNTFVDGAVRAGTLPDSVFDRNYVEYLSSCDTPMTNSVVVAWNKGLCGTPTSLDKAGNRHGSAEFINRAAADLRVKDLSAVRVTPVPGTEPAAADLFGNPLAPDTVGASSPPISNR